MTIPLTFGAGSAFGPTYAVGSITGAIAGVYNQAVLITVYQKETVGSVPITCTAGMTPDLVKVGEKVSTKGVVGAADVGDMRVAMFLWTPQTDETRTFTFSGGTDVMGCHYKTFTPTTYQHVRYEVAVATGQDLTGDATWSAALTAIDLQPDDSIFVASIIPTDVTTPSQFTADTLAATGIVFTAMSDQGEPDTTTGLDLGGSFFQQSVVSGSGTVSPTVTATVAGTLTNVYGPTIAGRVRAVAIVAAGDDTAQFNINIAAYSASTYVTPPDAGVGLLLNSSPIQEIPPGSEASIQWPVNIYAQTVPDISGNSRDMLLMPPLSAVAPASALMTAPGFQALALSKNPLAFYPLTNIDGVGDAITLSPGVAWIAREAGAWMDTAAFSVTAKVKLTTLGSIRTILGRWNGDAAQSSFLLRTDAANKLNGGVFVGASYVGVSSAAALASGTVYNVGVSHDGTTVRVYINGVMDGSIAAGAKNSGGNAPLMLGASFSPINFLQEGWAGDLDAVVFYNYKLSDAEFAALAL